VDGAARAAGRLGLLEQAPDRGAAVGERRGVAADPEAVVGGGPLLLIPIAAARRPIETWSSPCDRGELTRAREDLPAQSLPANTGRAHLRRGGYDRITMPRQAYFQEPPSAEELARSAVLTSSW